MRAKIAVTLREIALLHAAGLGTGAAAGAYADPENRVRGGLKGLAGGAAASLVPGAASLAMESGVGALVAPITGAIGGYYAARPTTTLDSAKLAAMRDELTKIATQGHPAPPHEYEEMTAPKWKQTAKDLGVALAGSAIGYGVGKTTSEYVMPHLLSSPKAVENAQKFLPAAAAATGGLGTYLLSMQRDMMKKRREIAERESQKQAGARVPAVANATRKDPWRTDNRYPNFT